jgi:hypothetical protein
MPSELRDPEENVRQMVLDYLREHPHAMDTLGGIAEWWIAWRMTREDLEVLSSVLEVMVADGTLERLGTGSTSRYRLRTAGE